MVPTPTAIVNPLSDEVGSLVPGPSHGHSINEDPITSIEPLKPAARMDKGKHPVEKGLQCKRKWAVSVKSDESIPGEGLMADARHASHEEEFFRINPGADPMGQLADVTDHCRQLLLHLRLPAQWLNECLSKPVWKYLR